MRTIGENESLTPRDLETLRGVIAGFLDLMAEHYARKRRGALRKCKAPAEDTPADRQLMGIADSCGHALKCINYMHDQVKYRKNIESAWDRMLGNPDRRA